MSEKMELIMDGEVSKIGNSFYVRIPAEQVKILGLRGGTKTEPGSRVLEYKEGNSIVVKFPDAPEPDKAGVF